MPTKKKNSFAERYEDLQKLVVWFERDDFDLEEGIEKYKEGLNLVKELRGELKDLENTITDIKKDLK